MADRIRGRWRRPLATLPIAVLGVVGVTVAAASGPPVRSESISASAVARQVPTDFSHEQHETLACYTCHENTAGHGALTVTTIEDCRSCHHPTTPAAVGPPCSQCHDAAPDGRFEVVRAVSFSVGSGDRARSLAFAHDRHTDFDCTRCHTQGNALAVPADLDCASCHEEHHTATSDCGSCHAPVHVSAHPPAEVHVTCSGAACHQDVPFESVPRTREFCLGCHREMTMHEAPNDCVRCHILPAPRPLS